jgi:hypothetical protein
VQQVEGDPGKAQAQFRTDQQAVVDALAPALAMPRRLSSSA